MEPITAREFINNLIAKSEPYIVDNANNIDIFILDIQGSIVAISPTHKLVINGHTYYYTLTPNNWIYLYNNIDFDTIFSETYTGTPWYGDHFSFGYSKEFPDILNFHLTSYYFDTRSYEIKRNSIYCDFKITDFITDSKNPKCTARKSNTYSHTTFDAVFSEDVAYIKDIITFGLTQEKIVVGPNEFLYKGKVFEIQTGPNGGLYIMIPKTDGSFKQRRITKKELEERHGHTGPTLELTETAAPAAPVEIEQATAAAVTTTELSPVQQTSYNTRARKKLETQNGGGNYTYKFQNLLSRFIVKFAKSNNIKLQNNTYIFVKQSTNHMIILFNYTLESDHSKHTKQYILNANTQLINKYMSPPGIKNTELFKNKLMYV